MRVAECYWGRVDEAARRSCVLLEDLGDLRMSDQATGCTAEEAELAVLGLARMHARWWGDAKVEALPWMTGPDYQGELWQGRYADSWDAFWRRFGPGLPAAFQPIGSRLCTEMADLFSAGAASASTLAHGDYRIANFLFGAPGSPDALCVLDWQLVSWGSGLRDLGYLLSQNLTADIRHAHEARLLRLYYDTLVEGGVRDYSFAACSDDYRRGLLMAMFIPVQGVAPVEAMMAAGPGDVSDEEKALHARWMESVIELLGNMSERAVGAIMANDAARVLPR